METIFIKIMEFIKELHILPWDIFKRFFLEENLFRFFIGLIITIIMYISVVAVDLFVLYIIVILIKSIIVIIRTDEIVTEKVQGYVVNKEYKESSYTYICTGKAVVPVFYPKQFLILVEYKGEELTFESEKKYNIVEVGDEIWLIMKQNLDKNKNVIKVEFELEE